MKQKLFCGCGKKVADLEIEESTESFDLYVAVMCPKCTPAAGFLGSSSSPIAPAADVSFGDFIVEKTFNEFLKQNYV